MVKKKPDYFKIEVERTLAKIFVVFVVVAVARDYFGIYIDVVWLIVVIWAVVDLITLGIAWVLRNG